MKTLFLAWQDGKSRYWYPIGRLNFDGEMYKFVYTQGMLQAGAKNSFQPLLSFPYLDRVYTSTHLFPIFANRLMPRSRPDYPDFLQWLNIPQHQDDPLAILARSGGQRVTDTFTVFPLPEPDEEGRYYIHFFSHGLRYLPKCSIEKINSLKPEDKLWLAHEFQNLYDFQALTLNTNDHHIVGYCPRYLNNEVLELISVNSDAVDVRVEKVNHSPAPLQFRLLCNITAQWSDELRPFSKPEYQPLVDVTASIGS
ncbi:DNA-binding protein [Aliterella atlantica CENA595]|uniref:DNA-binding protein n=1 Tax=Aliterella atlantica CENA595 TaxID=1618023 RepID=A0A0D8ZMT5_9CYAN|nr:HIRAN domain-containing protein [Aliterella atlantica]KJH70148.1 DNA-binding protein [Aliterella atlantica CENA595]